MPSYTYITDLAREVETPRNGILSRTLFQDEQVKLVLFGFDAGQELSAHTASVPAILQFSAGRGNAHIG